MARYHQCERCPHEHTRRCDTCNPDKPNEPEKITIEKAIEYFEEENDRFEGMLGNRVNLLEEYRINILAIEALKKVIL